LRFTLDSNILVYSLDRLAGDRHRAAVEIVARAATLDSFLTTQSIGECLNVIRRKRLGAFDEAILQARRWLNAFEMVDTPAFVLPVAAAFAQQHKLQLWDAILWLVARHAGAEMLISEDLQDGLSLDGLTVIDPFNSANLTVLNAILLSQD
jgi:predicted nucleic acid-binding protein